MKAGSLSADPAASSRSLQLARTVVALFGDEAREQLAHRLHELTADDWTAGAGWLDACGLELYLHDQLISLDLLDAIPPATRAVMTRHASANAVRTPRLFEEFARINRKLARARIEYVNVLGFALLPASCPDPTLRRQLSLDFIVSRRNGEQCTELLQKFGYSVKPGEHFLEFRPKNSAEQDAVSLAADIYDRRTPHSLGVYLVSGDAEGAERAPYDMLARRRLQRWQGVDFPALDDADHFIAQAIRMFGQAGIEWNRLSFLLEFRACMQFWRNDLGFWRQVIDRAMEHPLRPVAIGTAARLAREIYGGEIPLPIRQWTSDKVDARVQQWAELYGWDALLTEFPGSTLQAMLQDPLESR
jgi:hypothetical protein